MLDFHGAECEKLNVNAVLRNEVKRIKLQWDIEVTSKITKNHLFPIFIANNAK